jgi:2-polyprenyl-3-methyl-5-hydroxy-6-metoxy-1,4-benzoquinol methylase
MFKKTTKQNKNKGLYFQEALDKYTRLPNDEFVEWLYEKILGRTPDKPGKLHQIDFLKRGNSRVALVMNFVQSPEFINKVLRDNIHLIPIKEERPQQYASRTRRMTNEQLWVFQIQESGDFDWLEKKIIENGYYERQGVWTMDVDDDKKLMAEIALEFQPKSVLDFGCANGSVMKLLLDQGVSVEGAEISRMALEKAFPDVLPHIHLGDLRTLSFRSSFDVILGLDIFEHLNPNGLMGYLSRMYGLLEDEGLLFCNIPGYGKDPVFGKIHEVYLSEWDEDLKNNHCFHTIHVDDYGYPKNGHIINAGTQWWVEQFEKAGFRRETDIENALHAKYDQRITRISEARLSFYIFSKQISRTRKQRFFELFKNS